jgi:hypothetical protein
MNRYLYFLTAVQDALVEQLYRDRSALLESSQRVEQQLIMQLEAAKQRSTEAANQAASALAAQASILCFAFFFVSYVCPKAEITRLSQSLSHSLASCQTLEEEKRQLAKSLAEEETRKEEEKRKREKLERELRVVEEKVR